MPTTLEASGQTLPSRPSSPGLVWNANALSAVTSIGALTPQSLSRFAAA